MLIVLRDILICSLILVCVGEDWPALGLLYFLSKIITIIKMKCFEFIQICDILIECLHSKTNRFVFAFSHIATFNV